MLKIISVDAVRIRFLVDPKIYPALVNRFWACVKKWGVQHFEVKKTAHNIWGHWCELDIDGTPLHVGLRGKMGVRFMEYGFKGLPNVLAFNNASEMFEGFSFGYALAKGRVSNLELAADYAGIHSSEIISHFIGTKTSKIFTNYAGDGFTQYSGSVESKFQLSVYDKAVEMPTKSLTPYAEKILRIEMRFRKRKIRLSELVQKIKDKDPFLGVRIIYKSVAIAAFPGDEPWKLFILNCELVGVATALQISGPAKKTYLARLKLLNDKYLAPQLETFGNNIECLLSACSLAETIFCSA